MAAQGLQFGRINGTDHRRVVAPRPTRCRHCGTVAAEFICHICKRSKLEDPTLERAEQHEPSHGDLEHARDMFIALASVAGLWILAAALVIGAMLYADRAGAAEKMRFELLAGQCQAEEIGNGSWHHEHYPHELHLRSRCYTVSISELTGTWRGWDTGLRVGYVDLGSMHLRAIRWMRDEHLHRFPDGSTCDPKTAKDCLGDGRIRQRVQGIALGGLLEHPLGPVRIGLEGGLFVYDGSFSMYVEPWPAHPERGVQHAAANGVFLSPYFGATLNYGYLMASARVYTNIRAADHGTPMSGPTKGPATQILAGLQIPF